VPQKAGADDDVVSSSTGELLMFFALGIGLVFIDEIEDGRVPIWVSNEDLLP